MTQLLLLHAFPLDSRMWDLQRRALEEAGYDVVAPDLPGAGAEIGLETWAKRVLAEVDGAFIPVGISMGGYLAFELWRRGSRRISALVLVDTRATPDTSEGKQARDDAIRVLGELARVYHVPRGAFGYERARRTDGAIEIARS